MLKEFLILFNKADFSSTRKQRNSKIFYLDSFFLNNFFIRLLESKIKISNKLDVVIVSYNFKKYKDGGFDLLRNDKKLLIHYNISDKERLIQIAERNNKNEISCN